MELVGIDRARDGKTKITSEVYKMYTNQDIKRILENIQWRKEKEDKKLARELERINQVSNQVTNIKEIRESQS